MPTNYECLEVIYTNLVMLQRESFDWMTAVRIQSVYREMERIAYQWRY
jgi:hypothetical protein